GGGGVPGAAAVDARPAHPRPGRVAQWAAAVVLGVVTVPAPLRHVAVDVVQAERVSLLLADRVRRVARVGAVPGVFAQVLFAPANVPFAWRAGAAGVLPLGLRRQPVAAAAAHRDAGAVDLVVGLQLVPLAQAVAEAHGVEPAQRLDGVLARVRPLDPLAE